MLVVLNLCCLVPMQTRSRVEERIKLTFMEKHIVKYMENEVTVYSAASKSSAQHTLQCRYTANGNHCSVFGAAGLMVQRKEHIQEKVYFTIKTYWNYAICLSLYLW